MGDQLIQTKQRVLIMLSLSSSEKDLFSSLECQYKISMIAPEQLSTQSIIEKSDLMIIAYQYYQEYILPQKESFLSIPVIVVLDKAVADDLDLFFAMDIILKPLRYDEIVIRIQRALKKEKDQNPVLNPYNNYLFKTLIDAIPDLIWLKNVDGVYLACNHKFERFLGIRESDIIGKTDFDFVDYDLACFFRAHDLAAIKLGASNSYEEEAFDSDDGRQELLETIKTPMYDPKGELIGVLGIARNITQRQEIQDILTHSQKMDAIGQLAGGIAHDFNNMLGGIMGAAQLLQALPDQNEERERYLNMIIQASGRASELTKKLLRFSHKEKIAMEITDINPVIDDAISILKRTIDKSVSIKIMKRGDKHHILGNHSELQNILINLGINAAHAMPDGGIFTIQTSNVILDQRFCNLLSFQIIPGPFLNIAISDTGSGIASEHIHKIFEPFFTTKKKGTGLGLSAVYGIIKKHHGAITLESALGQGTLFNIYLPLYQEEVIAHVKSVAHIPGRGTILLIDDEPLILMTGEEILQDLGYRVFTATNGQEGVELFQKHHHEIDLLVVDMIMPEMSGYETIVKVREIEVNCPIVVVSGYIKDGDLEKLKQIKIQKLIRKPYKIEALSQIISDILTGL